MRRGVSALYAFLASVPRGLADLLAQELKDFGASDVRERAGGVGCSGTLEVAYRICLESRVASRMFVRLMQFEAPDTESLYDAVRAFAWSAHFKPGATLACEFSGRHPTINNTHFGALKLKDAIVDSLRASIGFRPDVAPNEPGLRVHAHANGSHVIVSLDLSGEGLHRRGYRLNSAEAPLRENLAAGILLRSGWSKICAAGGAFGSGELHAAGSGIEASLDQPLERVWSR